MPSAPPGLSREAPSGWHEVQWVQPRSGREALLPLCLQADSSSFFWRQRFSCSLLIEEFPTMNLNLARSRSSETHVRWSKRLRR